MRVWGFSSWMCESHGKECFLGRCCCAPEVSAFVYSHRCCLCVCVSALMSFELPLLLPPLSASLPRLVLLLPASIHPLCLVRCSTSQPTPFSSFVTVLIEMLSEPVLLSPRERCPPCCSHFPLFYPPTPFSSVVLLSYLSFPSLFCLPAITADFHVCKCQIFKGLTNRLFSSRGT